MKTKGFYTIQSKSMSQYGVTTQKDLWAKVKAEGYKGLSMNVKTEFKKGVESPYYHATFSSANTDRHGEIVMQVFDLSGFIQNPVYLDSHNYDSIEHIIGKIHNISTDGGALNGDVEFCLDNPKGVMAEKMVAGGFLNTSSIGFIPLVFDNDGNILESELLEISAVAVPANADALFGKSAEEVEEEKEEVAETTETVETPEEEKKEEETIEPVVEEKQIAVVSKKSQVAKVLSRMNDSKEKNYQLICGMAKELVIDGKKERARKIHQIVRELSK
jgi:hypothetical protein